MFSRAHQAVPLSSLWAIQTEFAQDALAVLASLEPRFEARNGRGGWGGSDDSGYDVQDGIAILALSGPLTKVASCYSWYFGGTSTVETRRTLADAIRDPKVKAVCFVIDSPGGEVAGTGELARDIARLKADKPIYAYVDDLCCSAAEWIASQCDKVYASAEAIVGSIGVVMSVTDTSEALNRAGVKKVVIATSDHKGAGTPGTVVTDAHKAEWQRSIDSVMAQFQSAVQAGRHLTDEQLAAVSDARVHVGAEAERLGLVDGVCSLDECLAKLQTVATERGATITHGARADSETVGSPDAEDPEENPMSSEPNASPLRMTVAGVLAGVGLHSAAARVIGASGDTTEAVGTELAQGVKAEVDTQAAAQVAAHPLLSALKTAGIETTEQLAALRQQAAWGDKYLTGRRETAEKALVVAFGVDTEAGRAQVESAKALVTTAGPELLDAYIGQWNAMAESKGLQGKDGKPLTRQSAAPALNVAVDVQTPAADKKPTINSQEIYEARRKAQNQG